MKILRKIDHILRMCEYGIVSVSIIALAIMLFGNIISRLLSHSWDFTEEIGFLLIILITFIGSIYSVRYGRHIRVTFLTDLLPKKYQKAIYTVVCLISALAFLFFTYWAFLYLLQAKDLGRITASLQIPKWTFQIPIVIGLFFTGVQYFVVALMNIFTKNVGYLGRNREMGDELEIQ